MAVELSESFFAQTAGWDAVKRARSLLEQDRVLSSDWVPPLLKGAVQDGTTSYRAGLVIKSTVDVENICTCRASREWGTICAHSVAVGLHFLRGRKAAIETVAEAKTRKENSRVAESPVAVRHLVRAETGGQGEPAEIYVIIPPNFQQALTKGKVMVCFEAKWQGGRVPLSSLPLTEDFSFSAQDVALLDRIEAIAGGETPGMLMLKVEEFAGLLGVLVEHPRVTLGRGTALTVMEEPWTVAMKAELQPTGEIVLSLKQKTVAPVTIGNWIYQEGTFRPSGLSSSCLGVLSGPIRIKRREVPRFLSQDWSRLQASGKAEGNFKLEDFTAESQVPELQLELKGGLAQLEAVLKCVYGTQVFRPGTAGEGDGGNAESFWIPDPQSSTRYLTRDVEAERGAVSRLQRAGFAGPDPEGRYRMAGQNQVLNFFAREWPRLQREWKVSMEERLEWSTNRNLERVEPRFQVTSSGVQWFDLNVSYTSSGGEQFSATDIQRLVLSGQGYTKLKSGKIALLNTDAVEELQEALLDCAPQQYAQGYRLKNTQSGFLQATLREQGWKAQAPTSWLQTAGTESGEAKMPCPPLGNLEQVLRPYQKAGVGWLHFLRKNNFGGILADEMGLGKTLQALTLLESVTDRQQGCPALVVCPTSLVWNWVAEAQKFTPGMKVLALHGAGRQEQFEHIAKTDLVVTSYATLRRDVERYRDLEFDTVVLDEAQHIKNRQTQNAQAVKSVRSRHRLVLTGTPLENSVLDLWSIFDFLMPGYLGAARDFRERYEVPIAQHHDGRAQARLARRLRPFILRRSKREVAPELPQKIEQVSYCELGDEQRAIYQKLLDAGRQEVLEAVGAQGVGRSRMVVLNVLLRLRQVCCDLRLLKLEDNAPKEVSGKVALFNELLEEVLDGGHRMLVFSQFVSMLALLREELDAREIPFSYLDGSTTNRAEVVGKFQNDASVPVFLISLKAGGLGLNLTGADTVIHFDPWWNPAVEDQATDRAHRIGQTRVVNSYKLITRDTVEDKILTLQNKKRDLIKATLGGEEQLAETLTWEEIQELLAG